MAPDFLVAEVRLEAAAVRVPLPDDALDVLLPAALFVAPVLLPAEPRALLAPMPEVFDAALFAPPRAEVFAAAPRDDAPADFAGLFAPMPLDRADVFDAPPADLPAEAPILLAPAPCMPPADAEPLP